MTAPSSRKPIFWILILSALGAIVSIWQTYDFYEIRGGLASFHSFCNIGKTFDCTAIEMSQYSEFFSGFPLSAIAISGYLLVLFLGLFGLSSPIRKNLKCLLVAFSTICVLFSLTYLYVMIFKIGKLCLLCLVVDAINVSLLVASLRIPSNQNQSKSIGAQALIGIGAAAVLIGLFFGGVLKPANGLSKEDINDLIESTLTTPSVSVNFPSHAPVIGNPNAPITIVKFSDYQCPACRMAATSIHPLIKRYPQDVKFVFVNYPLDTKCNDIPSEMHPYACEAAAVAVCAQEQGKFLEAYEALFEHQSEFSEGTIADLLSSVSGINLDQLKNCTHSASTVEKIRLDAAAGKNIKIGVTPTFYVNGKKVEGGFPTQVWIQLLDRMLKK